MADTSTSVSLDEKLIERIDKLALAKSRSRSGQIEYMLLEYLRRNEPPERRITKNGVAEPKKEGI